MIQINGTVVKLILRRSCFSSSEYTNFLLTSFFWTPSSWPLYRVPSLMIIFFLLDNVWFVLNIKSNSIFFLWLLYLKKKMSTIMQCGKKRGKQRDAITKLLFKPNKITKHITVTFAVLQNQGIIIIIIIIIIFLSWKCLSCDFDKKRTYFHF